MVQFFLLTSPGKNSARWRRILDENIQAIFASAHGCESAAIHRLVVLGTVGHQVSALANGVA